MEQRDLERAVGKPVATTNNMTVWHALQKIGGYASVPGFGRLIYSAFLRSDFVMMQSLMVLFSLIVIVVNLLTDVSYSFLDPRIRYA